MSPVLAIFGLGAVFLVLVVLMLGRGGHGDGRPPGDPTAKSTPDR